MEWKDLVVEFMKIFTLKRENAYLLYDLEIVERSILWKM